MGVPFAGDKVPRSAAREREIERMRTSFRQRSVEAGGLSRPLRPGHVLAKNETGVDIGFGRPAMISLERPVLNTLGTPIKDWDAQKLLYRLAPSVNMTSGMSYPFSSVAITTEPIKSNEIGIVAVSGLAISTVGLANAACYRPASGSITTSRWGWGRLVSPSAGGENFDVVDLSYRNGVADYEITSISGGTITAKIDPGHASEFTTTIFDVYGIASWQTTGDTGQCEWNGVQWNIINPWCAS